MASHQQTRVRAHASEPRSAAWRAGRPALLAQAAVRILHPRNSLWQRDELAMFLHFGVNTFTDREWGDGTEDPASSRRRSLTHDSGHAARERRGFRSAILTAKHHDGFCLWPTRTTTHSVAASPWRAEAAISFASSLTRCRAEGAAAGLYLSPWDRNNPLYGDSPRYNDLYCDQLTELLTHYGPLAEVWFDGANGEGPNGKKQVYDWPRVWALVRRLQPEAVMFSDAGPDVRWCGNEKGVAGDPNWSTVDPSIVAYPGASGTGVTAALQHGDPDGTRMAPGRSRHLDSTRLVLPSRRRRSCAHRGSTRRPLFELRWAQLEAAAQCAADPRRRAARRRRDSLEQQFHGRLTSALSNDLAARRSLTWSRTGTTMTGEIDLGRPARLRLVRLEEDIAHGQAVARYTVLGFDGGPWQELSKGTTIGYAKIDRIGSASSPAVRRHCGSLIEETVAPVQQLELYHGPRIGRLT